MNAHIDVDAVAEEEEEEEEEEDEAAVVEAEAAVSAEAAMEVTSLRCTARIGGRMLFTLPRHEEYPRVRCRPHRAAGADSARPFCIACARMRGRRKAARARAR